MGGMRNAVRENRDYVVYGVFSAADIQAPAVRQPRTWLFVDPFGESALMTALEAKLVDSGENLVVLVADDPGVFYKADTGVGRLPCTNTVQTYVDLAHAGGRGEEAAEAILQQRLRPAWTEREVRLRSREQIERGWMDAQAGRVVDGPATLNRIKQQLTQRSKKRTRSGSRTGRGTSSRS